MSAAPPSSIFVVSQVFEAGSRVPRKLKFMYQGKFLIGSDGEWATDPPYQQLSEHAGVYIFIPSDRVNNDPVQIQDLLYVGQASQGLATRMRRYFTLQHRSNQTNLRMKKNIQAWYPANPGVNVLIYLHVPEPSMSNTLRDIENSLVNPLFNRTT